MKDLKPFLTEMALEAFKVYLIGLFFGFGLTTCYLIVAGVASAFI